MVKFFATFHSELSFGQVIIISGIVRKSAENFTLNLLSDKNSFEIPLHVNVVFGENEQIIRNTKLNGEFGAAENLGGMLTKEKNPLKQGKLYVAKNHVITRTDFFFLAFYHNNCYHSITIQLFDKKLIFFFYAF